MNKFLLPLITVLFFGITPDAAAQCGSNTQSGASCTPRSAFYSGQYDADLGCGTYREITNYSPGEYFRMPVLAGGCYTIQTCGSGIDTQIMCYEATETVSPFAWNDDNGSACTGTSASVNITPNFTDYTRVDVRQYNCQSGGSSSITVRVRQNNNLSITSSATDMCQGQTRALTAIPVRTAATPLTGSGDRGSFSGTGVSGTTFTAPTPSGASQVYTITYTFGYCTRTQSIRVWRNPTIANAGPNQNICGNSTTLAANTPTYGSGQWTVVNGSASFGNASSPTSTVTVSGASATLRWTITNGPCNSSFSDVVITATGVAPTITCPSAQNVSTNTLDCYRTLSGLAPSVSGGCGAVSVTYALSGVTGGSGNSDASGLDFNVGTTTVTYTAVDAASNSASCSFNVNVSDNQPPAITCPSNIVTTNDAGQCGALQTFSVTATDNCSAPVTQLTGDPSGSTFPIGTTQLSFRAQDPSGNQATCSFSITVNDTQAPSISCPANISLNNTTGQCGRLVSWIAPVGSDNCPSSVTLQTAGPSPGSFFGAESTTTISYQVTDAFGNSNSCSFTVTVEDTENPVITCPSNIVVSNDAGQCSRVVSFVPATATDNCSSVNVVQTGGQVSSTQFGVNSSPNTVQFTATDAAGNSASCSFTITVNDTQNPTISCPSNIVVDTDPGECDAVVNWMEPVGADNCPGQSTIRTAGPAPGVTLNAQSVTTVSYEVTDAANNIASCSFTITVEDNLFPLLSCPANQTITFPNCQYTLPDYVGVGQVTYSDNCTPLNVVQTPAAASVITSATVVSVSVTDPTGNESVCAFTVAPLDNTPPTFDACPTTQLALVNNSCQYLMPDYTGLAVSDVCNPVLTLTQNPAVGTLHIAATNVTVTVSDGANSTNCVFFVEPNDLIPPSIICPADRTIPATSGCEAVLPDYTTLPSVVATDNCGGSPVVTQASVGATVSGTTTVTLVATDASPNQNQGSCTFNVTVLDNTPPVVTCPSSPTVYYNANCTYTMADFRSQTSSSDNCGGPVALVQVPAAGTSVGGPTTQVVITGADDSGNVTSCQFTLSIEDNLPPNLACPQAQQVNVNSNCEYNLADFTSFATSTDACSSVTISQLPASGTVYDYTVDPSITVTLTATDGATVPNSISCTFQVLLNDVTAPVITCGPDLNVLFNGSCQFVVGNRTSNYAGLLSDMDNCDSAPIITQSPSSSTVIQGQTTVTLTATDASGNAGTCQFDIIPEDSQPPSVDVCPQAPIVINYDGSCNYTLADYSGTASFSDNCDQSLTVTQSPGFGTVIATQLSSQVTLTATDDAGNSNTCVITIQPVDVSAPSLSCPGNQLESFNGSCAFSLPDYTGLATASDNCSNSISLTQSPLPGQSVGGAAIVTITANDGAGNSTQCSFNVIPDDNTSPTINCPTDQTVAFNSSCTYNMIDMTGLATGVSDNCPGNVVVTQSVSVGTSLGSNTAVVLTATDGAGNTTTCQFNVLPADQTDPTIVCPQNQVLSADASCMYDLLNYTSQVVATDFCDPSVAVTQSPAPTAGISIGTVTTVTLTATDDATNTSTCTFTVSAVDNTAPTILCPTDTVVSTDASCQYIMINETNNHELVVSDNCDSSPAISQSPSVSTVLVAGITTVTLTALDASGNSGSCTYTFTIEDQVNPTITCPADQLISSNSSCIYIIPDFTNSALVDDNCAAALTVTQSPLPLINTIVIDTVVTLTVTDGNGNDETCSFVITADDNDLPNITCPGNLQVNFDGNCQYQLGDYTGLAVATDNCGSPSVAQDVIVGDFISAQTTVTLTATDGDLNQVSCSFDVIPSDIGTPTVTCLQPSITVATGGQCSFTLPDYTGGSFVSATDNCTSSFLFTQSPVAGSLVGGSAVVTLSTVDPSGNVSSCTMTVSPEDQTAPVLFCPANTTVALDANCEFDLPDYTPLVFVSDNCDSSPFSITQSPLAATTISGEAVTTISFSVTDGGNNVGTCSFTVTTEDNQAPSISCPADVTVSANSNCEFTLADYTGQVSSSDNCSNPNVVQTPASGDFAGNVLVTITATDDAGNTNNCSFNVSPVDDTAPSLTCPPNQTPNFTSNCEFSIIDYTGLSTFSDNCDNTPFVTQSPSIGTIISGATTVTLNIVDDAGNSNSCSFDVLPEDHENPTIVCPADFEVSLGVSCDYSITDYRAMATASDNCALNPTLTQSPASGVVSGAGGSSTITITANDGNGNTASCNFDLLLVDESVPVLTNCPSNQTVALSASCTFIVPNYTGIPTANDNCDSTTPITQSPLAGSLIGGTTQVTLSATDDDGNIGTCSFTVTPNDVTPPTIFDCPSNIVVQNDLGVCSAVVTYGTITSIDNCAGVVVPQLTQGQPSGTAFNVGLTQVIFTADDGNGNSTTCQFDVTVNDTEDPIIICPANITVDASLGTCAADVVYNLPTVTDNCTSVITPTLESGLASGSNFPVGINAVSYGAVDQYGNDSSCSFTVTVVDNESPVIMCPANITVGNDFGLCEAVVTYSLPTVTDNCTQGITPMLTLGLPSGSSFPFGNTPIRYQAVDGAGNVSLCSFSVTVEDTEQPVLTCPNDTAIMCDAVVSYDAATAIDNCSLNVTIVETVTPIFVFGPNTVTFEGNDGNGNVSTCDFIVTIIDTVAPEITVCPTDQFESFDGSCNLTLPDYTGLASSTDNCDASPVISQLPLAGNNINGATTVTISSTDFAGNSSSCTFTVTDNTPPLVACPTNQTVGSDINCQYELLDYTGLSVASDNCGSVALSQSPVAGTFISALTTITVTAEDDFGNTSSCDFDVIIVDNISPSITCIGSQSALFDSNCMYQLPDYTGQVIVEDNCDFNLDVIQSPAAGSMIAGATSITLTAIDDDGNSTSCSFSLTPTDNIPPSISCPSSQIAQLDANCEYTLADYTGLGVTADNCATSISVTQTPAVGSLQALSTVVVLTAVDDNGNTSSCAFVVVPEDNVSPAITCPSDLEVDVNANCEYSLVDVTGLGASSDNCSSQFLVSQSPAIGTIITVPTSIELTTNDGNGNSGTCSFQIIPQDNLPPSISCAPDQFVVFDENCQFEISDYNGFAVTSDNCSNTIFVTQSPAAGTFISGVSVITLTATDDNGNSSNCQFTVSPDDQTAPAIACPADQNVSLNSSCAYVLLDYTTTAVASDNCSGNVTVSQDVLVGTVVTSSTVVTLTATDGNGNTESCSFSVLPTDNTAPSVNCPADQLVDFDANCEFSIGYYGDLVQVSDNCGVTLTQLPDEGSVISSQTEIVITVVDDAGNESTCSFQIVPSDATLPTITCPSDVFVDLDGNCQFVLPDYTAQSSASDNCSGISSIDQFPPSGVVILTATLIELTVSDAAGNEVSCSFNVVPEDNIDPIATQCPDDQIVVLGSNCSAQLPDYRNDMVATDNCDLQLEYQQQPLAGSTLTGVGVTTVQVGAIDDEGNFAFCEFSVETIDQSAPTINCPSNQVLALTANCTFILPDYSSLASANDACGDVTVTQSPVAGTEITGELNATLIVEDEDGNTSSCTFFVNVIDYEIEVSGTDVSCDGGNDGTATVTISGGSAPYTQDWGGFNPGLLAQGLYTVTVTDANGCSVVGEVTIGDGPSFVLETSPSGNVSICEGSSLSINAGSGYAVYNWSTGATVQSISVTNEGQYWVSVTNATGCVSNVDTITVSFYDSQVPEVTSEADGILSCSNDTASSYQWYLNGDPIVGATDVTYCPTVSGNYYVVITDSYGCTVTSFVTEYTFSDDSPCATGIEEHDLSIGIQPNPSTGQFMINYAMDRLMKMELSVYDLMGNLVRQPQVTRTMSGNTVIDLSDEAEGIYMLRIALDNNRVYQQRLVVVK